MDAEKTEKLVDMAVQSASRIARETMTFFCQAFSIFKDEVIDSQPEKTLRRNVKEIEGNKSVTLPSHNLLTVEQLADFLQVKTKTIYSWANTGKYRLICKNQDVILQNMVSDIL